MTLERYPAELDSFRRREELEALVNAEIERSPGNFAVVAIDLDELKGLNETEGHDSGDEYIKTARDVLQAFVRQSDDESDNRDSDILVEGRAIHVHGDEYWVILRDTKAQDQVDAFISRMKAILDDYGIEASMGGRVHRPPERVRNLLMEADDLLHDDKMRGVLAKYTLSPREEAELRYHARMLRTLLGRASLRVVQKYLDALDWRERIGGE